MTMTHKPHFASCRLSWSAIADDSLNYLHQDLKEPNRWTDGVLTGQLVFGTLREVKRRQMNREREVPLEAQMVKLDLNLFSATDLFQAASLLDERTQDAGLPQDVGKLLDRMQSVVSCATGFALIQTIQKLEQAERRIAELETEEPDQ